MRLATVVALLMVLGALVGVVVYGISTASSGGSVQPRWISHTERPIVGNHHAVAAGRIDGQPVVYAPISGNRSTTQCRLVALNATTGAKRWHYQIPPANCTIHSVADPTIADFDGDGTREVLTETTEQRVEAFAPFTGKKELSVDLTAYGYTQPLVANLTGTSKKEIVAADTNGTVVVARPNGTVTWQRHVGGYVRAQPAIADFTGDGTAELAVGFDKTNLVVFGPDGSVVWNRSVPAERSITWMTTGQADADPATEIVVATSGGQVVVLDGEHGHVEWKHDFGKLAAVHAFGDGDGDGHPEVYAVAQDGKLRSLNATTGAIEWTTTLTTEDVQMTPPPAMGDIDGDGSPELLAVTNVGGVSVVNPKTGEIDASYQRDVPIWEHPRLADTDGDGAPESYVIYGDGRVVALSYHS